MRKISPLIIISLLLFFLLTSIAYASVVTGDKQNFDLQYKVEYKNNGTKPIGLEIRFPIVENKTPHQIVTKMDIYPKPSAMNLNENCKFVVFKWKEIAPDKSVKFGYNARIACKRVLYNVDANKVTDYVPDKYKKYLNSNNRMPAKNPVVKKLARSIISGESRSYYRVLKFYDFVRKLKFKIKEKPGKVLEVIRTRICQCSDATDLFITLCRSIGIPARYVGGFYLKTTDQSTPDTHAWAEVYFHPYGWVPVDPTMGRFDDYTGFTRFSEIEAPYIILWKNSSNPFKAKLIDSKQKISRSDFKVSIKYKAHVSKSSLPLKKSYPALSLNLKRKKTPRLLSHNSKARNAYLRANRQYENGDFTGAEESARKAVRIDPPFAIAYRKLIQIYEKKNQLKALRKELSSKKNLKSSKGAVYYALGVIDTLIGNYSFAEKEFTLAKKKGMPSFLIAHNKGILYTNCKQVPKSAKYFDKSLMDNPNGLPTYRSFFKLLDFLNDYSTKATVCKKALKIKIHPSSFFRNELNKAYKKMKKSP
ncbi:MAG: hypothetical protein K8T10_10345 [Candidatus Eremiobacteraeota bacterium]|nr:hypothetical protein [Candidatus Eremiobacteraeota bacterium]